MNYESIFILPPSIHSLEERIRNRGDEDLNAIDLRLKNARLHKLEELSKKRSVKFFFNPITSSKSL